jgi:hypothetical protein
VSLHEDITRRLGELEELALRATAHGDMGWWQGTGNPGWIVDNAGALVARTEWAGMEYPWPDAALIAAVASPDVVLRAVAEDREVLKRHQRVDWYEGGAGCWYCSGEEDEGHRAVDYPCPEVLSLARRLGVTP